MQTQSTHIVPVDVSKHRLELFSDGVFAIKTGHPLTAGVRAHFLVKGYPFEVVMAGRRPSAALADQVKSLDWTVRKARYKGKASAAQLASVRAKIVALVGG
jgi:mRNA-degrading endonuclease toxin of MazEF toxin-antitoxin module